MSTICIIGQQTKFSLSHSLVLLNILLCELGGTEHAALLRGGRRGGRRRRRRHRAFQALKEADLPWERIGRKPRLPCMQAASQGRSYRHQGSSYALNKVMVTDVVFFKGFLWYYNVVIVRCPKSATKGFNQCQYVRNSLDPQRFNVDTKYSIHLL